MNKCCICVYVCSVAMAAMLGPHHTHEEEEEEEEAFSLCFLRLLFAGRRWMKRGGPVMTRGDAETEPVRPHTDRIPAAALRFRAQPVRVTSSNAWPANVCLAFLFDKN